MEKKVGLFINSASSPFYVPRLELAYIMTFKKKKKTVQVGHWIFFIENVTLLFIIANKLTVMSFPHRSDSVLQ